MLDFDLAVRRRSEPFPGEGLWILGGLARKNLSHAGL
jgi:hypothetical protein